jgi:hypothetical protein
MAANDIFLGYKGIAYGTGKNFPRGYSIYYDGNDVFLHYKGVAFGSGQASPEATLYTMTAKRCFSVLQGVSFGMRDYFQKVFPTLYGRGRFINSEVLE